MDETNISAGSYFHVKNRGFDGGSQEKVYGGGSYPQYAAGSQGF